MKPNVKLAHRLTQATAAAIFIFSLHTAHAQFLWSERVASASFWPEEPNVGLALDASDNCYVTGWFDGTNDFGGVTLTNQSAGGSDIFVAKYNASGALQWAQRAGGTSYNYGRGVGTDTNGNLYVAGTYQGPANFNDINLPATSGEEFFLAKYNNAGAVQWVQSSTGGSDQNIGIGLTVDSAGNSYAMAVMDHSATSLSFGSKTVTTANYGHTLLILVKYDNTGTAQWAQLFDSSQETYGSKVAVDVAGNVYVRGTFDSDMEIGTSNLVGTAGNKNIFVAKFNSSGGLIWIQQPQGDDSAGEGGVAVDPAGNVYVSGAFSANLDFGAGIILTNIANGSAPFGDAFIAKYNSVGAIQWAQSAGGTNGGFYWDLALDAQTNIYPVGILGLNAAVDKYNSAGTPQWSYSASGLPASPVSSGVAKCAVDSVGNCYLAGFYQGSATFSANTLQPQEAWNVFLAEVVTNPAVQFTASPSSGPTPLLVQFNSTNVDSLGNPITSWNWNFGDGTTGTNQNPSHTYTTLGTFYPSLIATNDNGIMAIGIGPTIVTTPGPPTVTIQPTNGVIPILAGSNVTLTVSVEGTGPFSYQWQLNGVNLPGGIITTVAGDGIGDGGKATNASLSSPSGVVVDAAGDLFIADSGNNRIRKVGANGIITTVAGNGRPAYTGDGGEATNASLNYPAGVAVGAAGNLFIADTGNSCIRKVGANGIITTVADNGSLSYPYGVAVGLDGNLFIADTFNYRIREVGSNGVITTVAGNGSYNFSGDGGAATNASLSLPYGVAVAPTGNLFIADAGNSRIREMGANGIITTVAGNGGYGYSGDSGAATNANLYYPYGVATDAAGDLFIADQWENRIRKVDTNGIITTVAGNGTNGFSGDNGVAVSASLSSPDGVAVDAAGDLFIADTGNNCIREVDTNGTITTVAGNARGGSYSGDGSAATKSSLAGPLGAAVDAAGDLLIGDAGNNRIRKVGTNGIITTIAGNGTNGFSGDNGSAASAGLSDPSGIAVDAAGNLFIVDTGNYRIRKVNANGIITTVAGGGTGGGNDGLGDGGAATNAFLYLPSGVAVDAAGNLFVADRWDDCVRKVDTNGIITKVADYLTLPSGVAVDAAGNLFIADHDGRILEEGTNGGTTLVAGNGTNGYSGDNGAATNASLSYPYGMAVDAAGDLFIADAGNNRIREVSTNGIITTIAGDGVSGYFGDGGTATNASLRNPSGVVLDGAGDLFIADTGNNCIRKVTPPSGSTLALNNVGFGNAGAYDVVVSSPYGSVTSSVVNVAVTFPQIILSTPQASVSKNNFTFQLSGPAGTNYVLQASTNLVDWSSISTSSIPISGSITISNAIGDSNRHFYRVYLQ